MNITVDRKWKKADYTIGRLMVDGVFLCNTLEDTDRGLKQSMALAEIKRRKILGKTAIPTGTYHVRMDIVSPKYSQSAWYMKNCQGAKVPRLEDVPGFSGILIHTGNNAQDTDGCILVGKNTKKGMVTESRETFLSLYSKMLAVHRKGQSISITIK